MFGLWNKFKKLINDYLEKLAKANDKSFGNEKLDCCKINNKNEKQ